MTDEMPTAILALSGIAVAETSGSDRNLGTCSV